MTKTVIAAVAMVLVGVGAGAYGRARSERLCQEAAAVAEVAVSLAQWQAEGAQDPFKRPLLQHQHIHDLNSAAKVRAGLVAKAWPHWHLEARHRNALGRIADGSSLESLAAAYGDLAAGDVARQCPGSGPEGSALAQLHQRARAEWRARLNEVRMAKSDFQGDQRILCQSDRLERQLQSVQQAQRDRCAKGRRGCEAKSMAAMEKEIADLQATRNFNLEKMRRKWPAEIMATLGSCP